MVALAGLIALTGCDRAPNEPIGTGDVTGLTVDTTASPFVREVTVTLARPALARLTWGAPGTPVLSFTTDTTSTTHRFLIPRLRAGRDYTIEARVPGDAALPLRTSLTTAPLDPALAAIGITTTGTPSSPVALIQVVGGTGFGGLLIIEDGEIVGHLPMAGSLFGAALRANGEIVLLDAALGLTSYTVDGTLVHRLPQADATTPYRRIHHDVIATPRNTLLFIADDTATVTDTLVTGESLWEWDPATGSTTKRFSAFDHLDWSTFRGARSEPGNWLHGNGIAFGPRGNVLMSFRNADYVASLSPDLTAVEWTMGGPQGTIALDPAERFYGQHFVSEPTEGRVLVFDNGWERPSGAYSRAVEFAVNRTNGTATKVWEYRPVPDIYASLVGSARRLANGNTLVLFGMLAGHNGSSGPITAVEVTPAGVPVWRFTAGANITRLYRIEFAASLIGEVPGSLTLP